MKTNADLVKLDRTSTNFQLQLFEFFKKTKWESKWDFLKYYQNVTRIYMNSVDVDSRGLLVYYLMGLGKSLLAISIAMDQIESGRSVIVLLTKSLQENMKGAIKKYIDLRKSTEPDYRLGHLAGTELDNWIAKHFSFVSMNASNMLKQMGKAAEGRTTEEFDAALEKKIGEVLKIASLDGKILIVDEAHNLFRAITNGSKNAIGLYDLVMKAKNLKCVFLTGTPIANDPFELVPCFNMLGSRYPGRITLPENYKDFTRYFVDDKTGTIKNKEKFQNRILGLVSHVTHKSRPGAALGLDGTTTRVEFPDELPTKVERVQMDPEQFVLYQLARDKEREEGGTKFGPGKQIYDAPNMVKPKGKASTSYRVRSRQLSNFCPPEGFREEKNPARIPKDRLASPKYNTIYKNVQAHRDQLGIVYSQFVGVGGLGTFMEYLKDKGWEQVVIQGTKKSTARAVRELEADGERDEYVDKAIVEPVQPTIEVTDTGDVIVETGDVIVETGDVETAPITNNVKTAPTESEKSTGAHEYRQGSLINVESYITNIEREVMKYEKEASWLIGAYESDEEENAADSVSGGSTDTIEDLDITGFIVNDTETMTGGAATVDPTIIPTVRYAVSGDIDAIKQYNDDPSAKVVFFGDMGGTIADLISSNAIIEHPMATLLLLEETNIIGFAVLKFHDIIETESGNACAAGLVYMKLTDGGESSGALFSEIVGEMMRCKSSPSAFRKLVWGGASPQINATALKHPPPGRKYRFAIISGDVEVEDRTALQDLFNSAQNMHGGVIDLLLLSSTGAEGLDLKNVRHIHIMEPYWNYGRIAQIKARGIRNDSHKALPKPEQNVQTYIYLAVAPHGEKLGEAKTTDEDLYDESLFNQTAIESFDMALKEVSIECMFNGEKNCRACNPTGARLYTDDPQSDLRAPDPCSQVQETQVKAQEILVDGVKYYYIEDPKSIYEYRVFSYDSEIDAYKPLAEGGELYIRIVEKIYEKEGKKMDF